MLLKHNNSSQSKHENSHWNYEHFLLFGRYFFIYMIITWIFSTSFKIKFSNLSFYSFIFCSQSLKWKTSVNNILCFWLGIYIPFIYYQIHSHIRILFFCCCYYSTRNINHRRESNKQTKKMTTTIFVILLFFVYIYFDMCSGIFVSFRFVLFC